ncbi:MAG: hypothetical protein K9G44_02115 [Melioribacteraceae bacterium]|nr:hypothetical protein [Melioribacteraceae bacterium]
MAEYRGFDVLDFIISLLKLKKQLLLTSILTLALSYTSVYYLIPPQYDSNALILSSANTTYGPIGAIGKDITSSLPLSALGISFGENENYDLFTTLIYSRTNLDKMIEKFDLMDDYGSEKMKDARKTLMSNIEVEITPEMAYSIKIRSSSPSKSVEMVNYLLAFVNDEVVSLNVRKSRENRKFLEERYSEVQLKLTQSEENMRIFQENNGLYEAETQIASMIESVGSLEKELIRKEVEKSVINKMLSEDNPNLERIEIEYKELEKKLADIRLNGTKSKIILPLNTLPEKALSYIRIYREIQIYNAMLEFLIPLYEQARYEEIKDIPVLQIIDGPVEAEKKNYPPRVLFALAITFVLMSLIVIFSFVNQRLKMSNNPKILEIRNEMKFIGKSK